MQGFVFMLRQECLVDDIIFLYLCENADARVYIPWLNERLLSRTLISHILFLEFIQKTPDGVAQNV